MMYTCHMMNKITVKDLTGLKPKEANFVIEYTKDFAANRAAEASGYAADSGHRLVKHARIASAIDHILNCRLETSQIDAEWVLMEAVDNHMIARQQGNITASTTALTLVAKHTMVDAMASDKQTITHDGSIDMGSLSDDALSEKISQLEIQMKQSSSI